MQYIIRGKNIEVTPSIRDKIEKTFEKISKYKIVDSSDIAHVEVRTYRENLARVTVTIDIKGKNNFLKAESQHTDLYVAIDDARHILEEQLRRMKDKWIRKGAEKFSKVEFVDNDLITDLDEDI